MKERINRLAKGIVENGLPVLSLSPAALSGEVRAGEIIRGDFLAVSENGLNIKGLIYSDHMRVRPLNRSFGGARSRVFYEINAQYLGNGEEISGAFTLVTNAGEKTVPFRFCVSSGRAGEDPGSFVSVRDFAGLARRDKQAALRIFESPDFIRAPFMEDTYARTVYDGLKGRPDREGILEEFLVALKGKEPVTVSVDVLPRCFRAGGEKRGDVVDITVNGWGYVEAQISTDASFIRLGMTRVSDRNLSEGHCRVPYTIREDKLHAGRNFGRIRVRTRYSLFEIPVEVYGKSARMGRDPLLMDKKSFAALLNALLTLKCAGAGQEKEALRGFSGEAARLFGMFPSDSRAKLMQAYARVIAGQEKEAQLLLGQAREEILKNRVGSPILYCFYQYLVLCVKEDKEAKESLIRYIKKLIWDGTRGREVLFLLLGRLDEEVFKNTSEAYKSLGDFSRNGNCSPFIYAAACRLVIADPALLVGLGEFELRYLWFGARKGLIDEGLALKVAALVSSMEKGTRRLHTRLVMKLYDRYPREELLVAVVHLLIVHKRTDKEAFTWYERALQAKANLTRLYEYFLYALPQDYGKELPREVLLYFSYEKNLSAQSRAVLYENILRYCEPTSPVRAMYLRSMEEFAMEQLFQGHIDTRLALLYDRMIYKDMVDVKVAGALASALQSRCVRCADERIRYVVSRFEELNTEESFPLKGGMAFVPFYSAHCVLFFQDASGRRFLNVEHTTQQLMDKPELLRRCGEVDPNQQGHRLSKTARILERGIRDEKQAAYLEEAAYRLPLSTVYRERLLEAVTAFCLKKAARESAHQPDAFYAAYLLRLDKKCLRQAQRKQVAEALTGLGRMREAYELIKEYMLSGIREKKLACLCTGLIETHLYEGEELLTRLAFEAFRAGAADGVLVDYLCEHFNGKTGDMYELLVQGVAQARETFDLEERLLGQMLFCGTCERMDSVFEFYTQRKNTQENVVKAYFTQKSIQFFLEDKPAEGRVFDYLKRAVQQEADLKRVPTIYLLALTRYYSGREQVDEEERTLLKRLMAVLLEANLVFPYTRELSRHIPIAEDILDKAMIEYRGNRERYPELMVRILPETQFHNEEMRRVYQGIYVKEKILFEGETMEYRIYDGIGGERKLAAEGVVSCDNKLEGRENSRFACLNRMSAALSSGDEQTLAAAMEDYLKKSAALKALFAPEISEKV